MRGKAVFLLLGLLLLWVLGIFGAASSNSAYADWQGSFGRGVFVLLKAGQLPDEKVLDALDKGYIDGISVRVHWKDLEPKEGAYDWRYIDEVLRIAKEHNGTVTLRVLGGFWAPAWIYEKGIESFEIDISSRRSWLSEEFKAKYGDRIRLPKVWQKPYVELWARLVRALGKRYSRNPHVTLIHMAGPTFFSSEPTLALSEEDLAVLRKEGFKLDEWREAWSETSRAYSQAFPSKRVCLNLNYVLPGENGLSAELVSIVREELDDRLVLGYNGLSLRHVLGLKEEPMISLVSDEGFPFGFQLVAPLKPFMDRKGVPERRRVRLVNMLLAFLEKKGAVYLEIYPQDLEPPIGELWGRW